MRRLISYSILFLLITGLLVTILPQVGATGLAARLQWRTPLSDVYWTSVSTHGSVGIDVGDVNGDGLLDVAAIPSDWTYGGGGTYNTLQVFDHNGNQLWSRTVLMDGGNVAMADVDLDGKCEVFVFGTTRDDVYSDGIVIALDHDGEYLWEYQDVDDTGYWAVIARYISFINIDEDPQLEVIIANGGYLNQYTYALDTNGDFMWRFIGNEAQQMLLGDITGDGFSEVIVLTSVGYKVYTLNAITGDPLWDDTTDNYNYGILGDMTNDGVNDIIVSSGIGEGGSTNRLYAYKNDGTPIWQNDLASGGENYPTIPVLRDLNGDGKKDVVVGAEQKIRAYSSEGDLLWSYGTPDFFNNKSPQVYGFDMNSDGSEETVFLKSKDIYLLSNDGSAYLFTTLPVTDDFGFSAIAKVDEENSLKTSYLVSADLNHDGYIEMLVYEVIGESFYLTAITINQQFPTILPEYPLGTLLTITSMFVGILLYIKRSKIKISTFNAQLNFLNIIASSNSKIEAQAAQPK